jgi:hypothetical protein
LKLYGAYPQQFGGGRGLDGEYRDHNNPVSLRALNPRERSFPNAAAGRFAVREQSRRVDHGGGRHLRTTARRRGRRARPRAAEA